MNFVSLHTMKTLFFAFSIALLAAGCTYEDGPAFSLRSKEARIVNIWVISEAIENGIHKTDDYKTAFVNYKAELRKDNSYTITYRPYNVFDYREDGNWRLSGDKQFILLKPSGSSQENSWKILRLKHSEAWIKTTIDDKEVELRFKD